MIPRVSATVTVAKPALQVVFDNLRASGFTVVGPRVRDHAVVLDELATIAELPLGYTEEQSAGKYRLTHSSNGQSEGEYFGFTLSPQSWKKYLYPPRQPLFAIDRSNGTFAIEQPREAGKRYAFVGVRACDLHAIALQDRVFLGDQFRDPHYGLLRHGLFALAVQCGHAAPTCFCASMKTGPAVRDSFDLAITELPDAFLIEVGSEAGSEVMLHTGWHPATAFDQGRALQVRHRAEREITRELRTDDLPRILLESLDHPRWSQAAARCLSCGSCTQVCPTCFCSTVEDSADLAGTHSERTRVWDSCYSADFSHVHGGNLRPTVRSRYRQWLTHKYASWKEQFGSLGCTGCGRCTVWCPVGLDHVQELKAIRNGGTR